MLKPALRNLWSLKSSYFYACLSFPFFAFCTPVPAFSAPQTHRGCHIPASELLLVFAARPPVTRDCHTLGVAFVWRRGGENTDLYDGSQPDAFWKTELAD